MRPRREEPANPALRARLGELDDREAGGAHPGAARIADARLHDLHRHGAINAIERKLDELRRARDQTQARIAFLEGPPDTRAQALASAPAPDDTAGVQDRAKNLERIARELEGTLFGITHEGSGRTIAEQERRIAEIEALRARDGSNAQQVDQLVECGDVAVLHSVRDPAFKRAGVATGRHRQPWVRLGRQITEAVND
jgi:hypothetical protein